MEPEPFDCYEYAAQEFVKAADVQHAYEKRGWAAPISGDATTLYRRYQDA